MTSLNKLVYVYLYVCVIVCKCVWSLYNVSFWIKMRFKSKERNYISLHSPKSAVSKTPNLSFSLERQIRAEFDRLQQIDFKIVFDIIRCVEKFLAKI